MRKERRRAPILLALLLCCSIGFDDQVAMTPVVSISVSVPCCMSRVDAVHMMDTLVLPLSDKGTRIQLSSTMRRDNTTTDHRLENVLTSTDPLLYDTYGEFPLSSLDVLLDRAVELRDSIGSVLSTDDPTGRHRKLKVVDLGSGCGRLALYMALTRPDWHVIGIEQSSSLHQEAVSAVQRTIQLGPLTEAQLHSLESMDLHNSMPQSQSELTLILGGASKWMHLIHSADIIFCYSTAFESGCFSESISALLLSNEWHDIITPLPTANGMAHENKPGDGAPVWCITTDKALDPKRGWMVVDRIDVCNPEVFESTGFIQRYDMIFAEETMEYSSVPRTSNSI